MKLKNGDNIHFILLYQHSVAANRIRETEHDLKRQNALNFLLKTDVYGSLEAIVDIFARYE